MLKIAVRIAAKAMRFPPLKINNPNILKVGQQNIKDRYLIHYKFATKKMAEPKLYTNKEDTVAFLKSIGLVFNYLEHEPCFTVEDMVKNIKLEKAPLIKNLFYSDKKNNYYLVVARHDTKVEKTLWKQINVAPGNIRLASDEKLEAVLKVKRGHVNPFALINDTERLVNQLFYKSIRIYAH